MVKEDIVGGLNLALSKGNSLKQAMLSFYYAGYSKEDIEEAAREIQRRDNNLTQQNNKAPPKNNLTQNNSVQNNVSQNKPIQNNSVNPKPLPKQSPPIKKISKKRVDISDYNYQKKKIEKDFLFIYLGISIAVFIGIMVILFIFREGVINFFTDILS